LTQSPHLKREKRKEFCNPKKSEQAADENPHAASELHKSNIPFCVRVDERQKKKRKNSLSSFMEPRDIRLVGATRHELFQFN
jgi:hypothetical protein